LPQGTESPFFSNRLEFAVVAVVAAVVIVVGSLLLLLLSDTDPREALLCSAQYWGCVGSARNM
jgi:hypothetical protein